MDNAITVWKCCNRLQYTAQNVLGVVPVNLYLIWRSPRYAGNESDFWCGDARYLCECCRITFTPKSGIVGIVWNQSGLLMCTHYIYLLSSMTQEWTLGDLYLWLKSMHYVYVRYVHSKGNKNSKSLYGQYARGGNICSLDHYWGYLSWTRPSIFIQVKYGLKGLAMRGSYSPCVITLPTMTRNDTDSTECF